MCFIWNNFILGPVGEHYTIDHIIIDYTIFIPQALKWA